MLVSAILGYSLNIWTTACRHGSQSSGYPLEHFFVGRSAFVHLMIYSAVADEQDSAGMARRFYGVSDHYYRLTIVVYLIEKFEKIVC